MIPIITRPHESDASLIFNIFHECRSDMITQGIEQWDNIYPDINVIQEDLDNKSIFIARMKNEIAGVASFDNKVVEEYKTINWANNESNACVIHRLAVKAKYQGLSIAKELIQFVHACSEM